MESQPLISVIVPVYNTGKYLSRCLESLNKQTYQNLQIILVDDGSSDNSPALCDQYAQTRENVCVLHKENAGLGFARNSGLALAKGEYITFLDSDDFVHRDMYRNLVTALQKTEADAAFCDFCMVSRDGVQSHSVSGLAEGCHSADCFMLAMLGALPEAKRDFDFESSACKGIYSSRIIEANAVRFPSERELVSEDLVFNIRFLQNAKRVTYLKKGWYYYCENLGSLTRRFIPDRLKREKVMYHAVVEILGDMVSSEVMLRWNRLFLGRVRATISQYCWHQKGSRFRTQLRAIREIADDELIRSVIRRYPINRNPMKLRIFNTFLKWRFCLGMYLLIVMNR